ncbi:MAG: hypothetical protein OWT28_05085, partial [Firmicutes bacterium]|nr:hypothetical protein [Bacillota bacterium]
GRAHAEAAVRWLVEQKLCVSIEDIPKAVRFTTFKDYGLDTMIKTVFGGSPFQAIDAVYPGRFRPWQFGCAPRDFWSGPDRERHIQEAMEWLVYDKLQLSREAPPVFLPARVFEKHGLGGLLVSVFGRNTRKALAVLSPLEATQKKNASAG